jgi:Helix-turn-helix domain
VDDDLLTLGQLAQRCPISAAHLRLLARSGRISARKIGRDWFATESAVRAYLDDPDARSRDPYKHRRDSGQSTR